MKSLKEYITNKTHKQPNMFCMLKPGFTKYECEFDNTLKDNNWEIYRKKRKRLAKATAETLYSMHHAKPFYPELCDYMSSDDCICYACHKKVKDPIKDMDKLKGELRDKYGVDDMKNFMHSSDSAENVNREIEVCMD